MLKLSNCVSIIVPSTQGIIDKAGATNTAKQVDKIATKLSLLNGGTTITKGTGTWYSSELKTLVTEDVTIVKSYCETYDIEKLVAICETLKQETLADEAIRVHEAINTVADTEVFNVRDNGDNILLTEQDLN